MMVNFQKTETRVTKAIRYQQDFPDRRLSLLEVSVIVTALLCLLIFGVLFLNKQLMKNQTDQMAGRAQSVADWITAAHDVRIGMLAFPLSAVSAKRARYPTVFRIW